MNRRAFFLVFIGACAVLIATATTTSPFVQILVGVSILVLGGFLLWAGSRIWKSRLKDNFFRLRFTVDPQDVEFPNVIKTLRIKSGISEIALLASPRKPAGRLECLDIRPMRFRWGVPSWLWDRSEPNVKILEVARPVWSRGKNKDMLIRAEPVRNGVLFKPRQPAEWGESALRIEMRIEAAACRSVRISLRGEMEDGQRLFGRAKIRFAAKRVVEPTAGWRLEDGLLASAPKEISHQECLAEFLVELSDIREQIRLTAYSFGPQRDKALEAMSDWAGRFRSYMQEFRLASRAEVILAPLRLGPTPLRGRAANLDDLHTIDAWRDQLEDYIREITRIP